MHFVTAESETPTGLSKSLFSVIPSASFEFEKYVLKISATSISPEINSSFSTKTILSRIPPLSLKNGFIVS